MAEAGAVAGPLDQAGDVGDHQLALVGLEHAEHRRERREGVVGDLRRGSRETGQQRGLARVGKAHEPDVGEQTQLQRQPSLLARQAPLPEAGGLPGGGGEVLVAGAAAAPVGEHHARPGRQQLPGAARQLPLLLGVGLDPRARRNRQLQRLPVGSVAHAILRRDRRGRPGSGPAPVGLEVTQGVVADGQHVPAAPAVTAVGSAPGNVGFAAEADGAVAAGPGLDVDPRAVVEHRASNRDRPAHGFRAADRLDASQPEQQPPRPRRPKRDERPSNLEPRCVPDHGRLLGDRRRDRATGGAGGLARGAGGALGRSPAGARRGARRQRARRSRCAAT